MRDGNTNYRENLEKVYEKVYCDGACINYECCKASSLCAEECGHQFYKAKIGKEYGNLAPKVLFVGKEAPDNCGNMSGFALEEPADVSRVPKNNTHYFGTIYTAARLLSKNAPVSATRADVIKYGLLRHYFCLTNYYKCAFKESPSRHNVHANREMKKRCFSILLEEINALKPDIVIIQGKFTSSAFWNNLMFAKGKKAIELFSSPDKKIGVMQYYHSDNSPFYVVWGYHPSSPKWGKTLEEFNQALFTIPKNK